MGLAAHFRGLYLSFETDQRPERITEAGPAATATRRRMLIKQYDLDNLGSDNFYIDPLGG